MQMSQEIQTRMMKKINPRTSTAAIALLLGGGMLIMTSSEVVGQQQQQPTSPLTSFSVNQTSEEWTASFDLENCDLTSAGENSYFVLEPGHQVILEGQEDGEELQLTMTVLDETKVVDGVETRVVEEKESEGGDLVEVSWNYFAICKPTNDVFYFGEDVDIYEDSKIVSHEGAWVAGQNGAKAGMIMPGRVEVGLKYYQEISPGVAEG